MRSFLGIRGRVELESIEPPGVAGLFYPADRESLRESVRSFMADKPAPSSVPKAVIAPHAGYRYSGGVAGSAYAALAPGRGRIERVVIMGPAHRMRLHGVAISSASLFRTPAGDVPVDDEARTRLLATPHVTVVDAAFAEEHCLEVQLPFLIETLGRFRLVPLLVGEAAPDVVAAVLETVWGGAETVIVISSDLSHYHAYDEAVRRDTATARAIVSLAGGLAHEDACGKSAINGLAEVARRRGLRATELDRANSGDTAGPRDRVVGYGAYAFHARASAGLDLHLRRHLLGVAASAIRKAVDAGGTAPGPLPVESLPEALRAPGAAFVSLHLDGRLRGCIGTLEAHRPLGVDVAANAFNAAFNDPRFPPLSPEDAARVEISISVLGVPERMTFSGEADLVAQLRPGIDGLILREGESRGTFLPVVWESIPAPREFVRALKKKAGIAPDHWSGRIEAWRYTTQGFS